MNVREEIWGAVPTTTKPRRRPRAGARIPLPPKGTQLSFAQRKTWGGPRPNAGRKKRALRPKVRHRRRPEHRACQPVLVTMRRAKGLPNLRTERLLSVLRDAIAATKREGFRIVYYSVQADHVHLVVEADTAALLTTGMRSFAVRVAMRVNRRVLSRKTGKVWGDRHHRRELTSPSEVRNVLVYVLNNHLKHGEYDVGLVDPCSSAPHFDGWMHRREPKPPDPPPTDAPSTWLLEKGWSTVGFGWLVVGEVPRALR